MNGGVGPDGKERTLPNDAVECGGCISDRKGEISIGFVNSIVVGGEAEDRDGYAPPLNINRAWATMAAECRTRIQIEGALCSRRSNAGCAAAAVSDTAQPTRQVQSQSMEA